MTPETVKLLADNAMILVPATALLVIVGIFLGFFFRRKGLDQAVEEITSCPSFGPRAARVVFATSVATEYGDGQQAHAFRDPRFGDTVQGVIKKNTEVREEIIKVLAGSKELPNLIGDIVTHKLNQRSREESALLDLRFEKLQSEISQNVRDQMSASQTMLLTEIRRAIDMISGVRDDLGRHIAIEAAVENERREGQKGK